MSSTHGQDVTMSESDAGAHLREKHLQMVMDAQQAGREIPRKGVSVEQVGIDTARMAVEASQNTMKRSTKRSFLIPALPWHRIGKQHEPLEDIIA